MSNPLIAEARHAAPMIGGVWGQLITRLANALEEAERKLADDDPSHLNFRDLTRRY